MDAPLLIQLPKETFCMKTRYMIIRKYAKIYKKASKEQKTKILDLLTGMLSMSRNYIAYLLRNTGKIVSRKGNIIVISDPTKNNLSKRGRKKVYGEEVLSVLKISASTIDRLLKSYRERIKFERRKRRNPFSSNLKK